MATTRTAYPVGVESRRNDADGSISWWGLVNAEAFFIQQLPGGTVPASTESWGISDATRRLLRDPHADTDDITASLNIEASRKDATLLLRCIRHLEQFPADASHPCGRHEITAISKLWPVTVPDASKPKRIAIPALIKELRAQLPRLPAGSWLDSSGDPRTASIPATVPSPTRPSTTSTTAARPRVPTPAPPLPVSTRGRGRGRTRSTSSASSRRSNRSASSMSLGRTREGQWVAIDRNNMRFLLGDGGIVQVESATTGAYGVEPAGVVRLLTGHREWRGNTLSHATTIPPPGSAGRLPDFAVQEAQPTADGERRWAVVRSPFNPTAASNPDVAVPVSADRRRHRRDVAAGRGPPSVMAPTFHQRRSGSSLPVAGGAPTTAPPSSEDSSADASTGDSPPAPCAATAAGAAVASTEAADATDDADASATRDSPPALTSPAVVRLRVPLHQLRAVTDVKGLKMTRASPFSRNLCMLSAVMQCVLKRHPTLAEVLECKAALDDILRRTEAGTVVAVGDQHHGEYLTALAIHFNIVIVAHFGGGLRRVVSEVDPVPEDIHVVHIIHSGDRESGHFDSLFKPHETNAPPSGPPDPNPDKATYLPRTRATYAFQQAGEYDVPAATLRRTVSGGCSTSIDIERGMIARLWDGRTTVIEAANVHRGFPGLRVRPCVPPPPTADEWDDDCEQVMADPSASVVVTVRDVRVILDRKVDIPPAPASSASSVSNDDDDDDDVSDGSDGASGNPSSSAPPRKRARGQQTPPVKPKPKKRQPPAPRREPPKKNAQPSSSPPPLARGCIAAKRDGSLQMLVLQVTGTVVRGLRLQQGYMRGRGAHVWLDAAQADVVVEEINEVVTEYSAPTMAGTLTSPSQKTVAAVLRDWRRPPAVQRPPPTTPSSSGGGLAASTATATSAASPAVSSAATSPPAASTDAGDAVRRARVPPRTRERDASPSPRREPVPSRPVVHTRASLEAAVATARVEELRLRLRDRSDTNAATPSDAQRQQATDLAVERAKREMLERFLFTTRTAPAP